MSSSNHLAQCPGLTGLNAYIRPLSIADVKSCVAVESTFPEQERCSEEKVRQPPYPLNPSCSPNLKPIQQFNYRLAACPALSIGLFIATPTGPQQIGHVIANRTSRDVITEASMGMPENWPSQSRSTNDPIVVDGQVVGNDPSGENIAIHSVVTIPEFQGRGVGTTMVKSYIEYIRERGFGVKKAVLIAHDYLIRFYEGAGFENRGLSECRFAGDVWMDLVRLYTLYFLG